MNVSADKIRQVRMINIKYFKTHPFQQEKLIYGELIVFKIVDQIVKADLLWKATLFFHSPHPAWSGMVQFRIESAVVFMPMTDMNVTDMSCIYSTSDFISQQTKSCGATPIVTVDQ